MSIYYQHGLIDHFDIQFIICRHFGQSHYGFCFSPVDSNLLYTIPVSLTCQLSVCPSRYLLYFHFSLFLLPLCSSVCSPAAVPPCSPVWIVCLLLLLTTSAIQTSSLLHSFLYALETLILHLTVPSLTSPLLHCACHRSPISLFHALILSLGHLPLKPPLTTASLPPSTTPV